MSPLWYEILCSEDSVLWFTVKSWRVSDEGMNVDGTVCIIYCSEGSLANNCSKVALFD